MSVLNPLNYVPCQAPIISTDPKNGGPSLRRRQTKVWFVPILSLDFPIAAQEKFININREFDSNTLLLPNSASSIKGALFILAFENKDSVSPSPANGCVYNQNRIGKVVLPALSGLCNLIALELHVNRNQCSKPNSEKPATKNIQPSKTK